MKKIGVLHVLTDTLLQDRYSHLDLARLAAAGGADTVQYRQICDVPAKPVIRSAPSPVGTLP
jgi:thiamine-phosphate pyrophosphorylase